MTKIDQYTYSSSYDDGKYWCSVDEFLIFESGATFEEAQNNCRIRIQEELDSGKHKQRPKREREQWIAERDFMPYVPTDDVSDLCDVDIIKNFTPEQEARWKAHEVESREHDAKRLQEIANRFKFLALHIESGNYPKIMALKIPKNSIGNNGTMEHWGVGLSHPWGG